MDFGMISHSPAVRFLTPGNAGFDAAHTRLSSRPPIVGNQTMGDCGNHGAEGRSQGPIDIPLRGIIYVDDHGSLTARSRTVGHAFARRSA